MEEQKTLLDYLLDPVESERVLAMAGTLAQTDGYLRTIALMLAGMSAKATEIDAKLDLVAAERAVSEIRVWLVNHSASLYLHLEPAKQTVEVEQAVTVH